MTDIIERAHRLLAGATPGPWKFEERVENEYPAGPEWGSMMTELEHSVQDKEGCHLFGAYNDYRMIEAPGNLPLAAAAPELAKAVIEQAEEIERLKTETTWEYGVTYTGLKHGGNHIEWIETTDDPEWDKETLALKVRQWRKRGQSPQIVRRRVSPVEVIE